MIDFDKKMVKFGVISETVLCLNLPVDIIFHAIINVINEKLSQKKSNRA